MAHDTQESRLRLAQELIFSVLLFAATAFGQSTTTSTATSTSYSLYAPLPTQQIGQNGSFLWPWTTSVQRFKAGDTMNISWTSDFTRVNLWGIPNQEWNNGTAIHLNTEGYWYEWTVSCGEQCSVPWLIRAVNAQGTQSDQTDGGFASGQFWIEGPDPAITTTSSTITTSLASPTGSAPVTATPSATDGAESGGSSSSVAIGVGVGVGVGVAVLLAAIGGFFVWRHYRKKNEAAKAESAMFDQRYSNAQMANSQSPPMFSSPQPGKVAPAYAPAEFYTPGEHPQQPVYYEAPVQRDPQELDGGFVAKK